MTQPRCRHLHRVCLALTLLGALSAACRRSDTPRGSGNPQATDTPVLTDGETPPPLPQGCPAKGPPKTRKELDACVGSLQFDTLALVGDEQRLLVVGQGGWPCPDNSKRVCRHGPLAKIEPATVAHQYSDDDLKQGRIIARLFVRRGDKGYPKLALTPGDTTYWWVQRDTGQLGRSLFISQATVRDSLLTREDTLHVEEYPRGTFMRALARWFWLEDDETAKGTCGSATCVSSGGH
jgi:hypothetical protein